MDFTQKKKEHYFVQQVSYITKVVIEGRGCNMHKQRGGGGEKEQGTKLSHIVVRFLSPTACKDDSPALGLIINTHLPVIQYILK